MRGTICLTCGGSRFSVGFAALSRAAAKAAGARLRRFGALPTHPAWTARAAECERCPIKVVRAGVSWCGTPFLRRLGVGKSAETSDAERDPTEGCGCPTREKARSPAEHCPLDRRHRPAVRAGGACNCKWCDAGRPAGPASDPAAARK